MSFCCFTEHQTVRQLQCERSDETLVFVSFGDSEGHRSREVCGYGEHWNEKTPKCAERQAVLRKRLCENDRAPFWVEPVACSVLSRYSYGVDAQQPVAVDLDSRMRRNSRISGANVNEELRRQVPSRK